MLFLETIKYLESFVDYERASFWPYQKALRPERMIDFLSVIKNPQNSFRSIHVAGTKGKGSTCAFIAYILRRAGFKTGLYTSPHLEDFRERIRILGARGKVQGVSKDFEGMISRQDLSQQVAKLKPAIEKFNRHSRFGALTFFEVYTALAFNYFKEKKIDFAVLETGLGGRLDATNAVNALVSVITPISLEHTDKLGRTLKAIAREKAGIIKNQKQIIISAPQEKDAQEVIRKKCRETGAKLYEVCAKIQPKFRPQLLGQHQLSNAAVAAAVAEALSGKGIKINKKAIQRGIASAIWPGRCEIIRKQPFIVLDGAQNVASMLALAKTVKQGFKYNKLILVLGVSSDKDIAGICKVICPLAGKIILTQANTPRAASVDRLAKAVGAQGTGQKAEVIKTKTVREAKKKALQAANKEDLILVTGSLFVVGEFRSEKL